MLLFQRYSKNRDTVNLILQRTYCDNNCSEVFRRKAVQNLLPFFRGLTSLLRASITRQYALCRLYRMFSRIAEALRRTDAVTLVQLRKVIHNSYMPSPSFYHNLYRENIFNIKSWLHKNLKTSQPSTCIQVQIK